MNNGTILRCIKGNLIAVAKFPLTFVKEFFELPGIFSSSSKELRLLSNVVFCGLMGALSIIMSLIPSINLGYSRVTFGGYPARIVDFLFGPFTGGVFAFVMDIVNFMIKPDGQFNFLYTLIEISAALIYGSILYKKKISILRIFFAQTLVKLFVNAGLTTYVMSITMGKAMDVLFIPRLIKNILMIPVDTVLLFMVLTAVSRAFISIKRDRI